MKRERYSALSTHQYSPSPIKSKSRSGRQRTHQDSLYVGGSSPTSFVESRFETRSFLGDESAVGGTSDVNTTRLKMLETQRRVRALQAEKSKLTTTLQSQREKERVRHSTSVSKLKISEQEREHLARKAERATQDAKRARKQLETARASERKIGADYEALQRSWVQSQAEIDRANLAASQATQSRLNFEALNRSQANIIKDEQSGRLALAQTARHQHEQARAENIALRRRCEDLEVQLQRAKEEAMMRPVVNVQSTQPENSFAAAEYVKQLEMECAKLELQNDDLRIKLVSMDEMVTELAQESALYEGSAERLRSWQKLVGSVYPSMEAVEQLVSKERSEKERLSELLRQSRAETARAREMTNQREQEKANLKAEVQAAVLQSEEREAALARADQQLMNLTNQLDAERKLLESFNDEGKGFTDYDKSKSERIRFLEKQVTQEAKLRQELEKQLRTQVQGTKVLHMRINPESEATGDAYHHGGGGHGKSSRGPRSADVDKLRADNIKLVKRIALLKKVVNAKIVELRTTVYELFGWRLDINFEQHTYTLTRAPGESLKFQRGAALDMLETPFAMHLVELGAMKILEQYHSIPAFLGNLILESVQQNAE